MDEHVMDSGFSATHDDEDVELAVQRYIDIIDELVNDKLKKTDVLRREQEQREIMDERATSIRNEGVESMSKEYRKDNKRKSATDRLSGVRVDENVLDIEAETKGDKKGAIDRLVNVLEQDSGARIKIDTMKEERLKAESEARAKIDTMKEERLSKMDTMKEERLSKIDTMKEERLAAESKAQREQNLQMWTFVAQKDNETKTQIRKLNELRDESLITTELYEAKLRDILMVPLR